MKVQYCVIQNSYNKSWFVYTLKSFKGVFNSSVNRMFFVALQTNTCILYLTYLAIFNKKERLQIKLYTFHVFPFCIVHEQVGNEHQLFVRL